MFWRCLPYPQRYPSIYLVIICNTDVEAGKAIDKGFWDSVHVFDVSPDKDKKVYFAMLLELFWINRLISVYLFYAPNSTGIFHIQIDNHCDGDIKY